MIAVIKFSNWLLAVAAKVFDFLCSESFLFVLTFLTQTTYHQLSRTHYGVVVSCKFSAEYFMIICKFRNFNFSAKFWLTTNFVNLVFQWQLHFVETFWRLCLQMSQLLAVIQKILIVKRQQYKDVEQNKDLNYRTKLCL